MSSNPFDLSDGFDDVTDEERASEINHFQEEGLAYYQQNGGNSGGLITINPITAAQRMMDNMSMEEESL